jgi:hypothetical protein
MKIPYNTNVTAVVAALKKNDLSELQSILNDIVYIPNLTASHVPNLTPYDSNLTG